MTTILAKIHIIGTTTIYCLIASMVTALFQKMKDAGNEIDGKEGNTDFDIRMRKNCPKCGKGEDILEDILQGENILHILED